MTDYTITKQNDCRIVLTKEAWNSMSNDAKSIISKYEDDHLLTYETPSRREDGYIVLYHRAILRARAGMQSAVALITALGLDELLK